MWLKEAQENWLFVVKKQRTKENHNKQATKNNKQAWQSRNATGITISCTRESGCEPIRMPPRMTSWHDSVQQSCYSTTLWEANCTHSIDCTDIWQSCIDGFVISLPTLAQKKKLLKLHSHHISERDQQKSSRNSSLTFGWKIGEKPIEQLSKPLWHSISCLIRTLISWL